MYKLISNSVVQRLSDKAIIAEDETNRDWTDYQSWISDGNSPVVYETLSEALAEKTAQIAASRYALETSGITVNGVEVKTDRESQAMLNGALTLVTRNPSATIKWKGANGFVTLDAAQIGALADAVSAHVQACFTAESAKVDELDAITTFQEAVDFDPVITI